MARPALTLETFGLSRRSLFSIYRSSGSLRRAAQILGCDPKSLQRLLVSLALPPAHPGHPRALAQVPPSALFRRSIQSICHRFGVSRKTVYLERKRRTQCDS